MLAASLAVEDAARSRGRAQAALGAIREAKEADMSQCAVQSVMRDMLRRLEDPQYNRDAIDANSAAYQAHGNLGELYRGIDAVLDAKYIDLEPPEGYEFPDDESMARWDALEDAKYRERDLEFIEGAVATESLYSIAQRRGADVSRCVCCVSHGTLVRAEVVASGAEQIHLDGRRGDTAHCTGCRRAFFVPGPGGGGPCREACGLSRATEARSSDMGAGSSILGIRTRLHRAGLRLLRKREFGMDYHALSIPPRSRK